MDAPFLLSHMSLTLEENEYEYRRVSEGEQGILQKNAMYSKNGSQWNGLWKIETIQLVFVKFIDFVAR